MKRNIYSQLGPESTIDEIRKLIAAIKQEPIAPEAPEKPEGDEAPSELLKQANPDTETDDDKENVEEPVEDGVEEDPIPIISERLDDLEQSINQLSDYITKFQNATDTVMLPLLENVVSNMRLDYKSGYELTTFYTKGWFSRSFMSSEGKREFAEFLYNTVKPYCNSNLETWAKIKDRDPDLSLYIAYPRTGA